MNVLGFKPKNKMPWFFFFWFFALVSELHLYTSKKKKGKFLTEPTSAKPLVTKWNFLNRTLAISHLKKKKSGKMNRKYRTEKKGESLNTFTENVPCINIRE